MTNQEQATKDLIAIVAGHHTPEGVKQHLYALSRIMPLVEQADDERGENACVEGIKRDRGDRIIEPFYREALRELCHYPPDQRGPIVHAALQEAKATAKESTRLGRMENRYSEALEALDPKFKAVLRIVSELNDASGNTTEGDFLNVWYGAARGWPVDALRNDPAFAELLGLFDLAERLNEANG